MAPVLNTARLIAGISSTRQPSAPYSRSRVVHGLGGDLARRFPNSQPVGNSAAATEADVDKFVTEIN